VYCAICLRYKWMVSQSQQHDIVTIIAWSELCMSCVCACNIIFSLYEKDSNYPLCTIHFITYFILWVSGQFRCVWSALFLVTAQVSACTKAMKTLLTRCLNYRFIQSQYFYTSNIDSDQPTNAWYGVVIFLNSELKAVSVNLFPFPGLHHLYLMYFGLFVNFILMYYSLTPRTVTVWNEMNSKKNQNVYDLQVNLECWHILFTWCLA